MKLHLEKQEHRKIGDRIKELRKNAGLSQTKLGDALGVSFQQVQKYETGQNRVAADRLQQIASVLGADIGDFYGHVAKSVRPESEMQGERTEHRPSTAGRTSGSAEFWDAFDRIKDPRARYLLAELARVFLEIEQR